MRVSIIGGTGDLGFALALRLAKAGEEVVIGSRRVEKAVQAAQKLLATIGNVEVLGRVNREAVKGCRFIFFTIPYEGLEDIACDVASGIQDNCIVVSCIVPMQDNSISAAEVLASLLPPHTKVLSALHTVSASAMQDLDRPLDTDTFIFGDSVEEKKALAQLLRKVNGLRPIDGGPLKNSRYGEAFTRFLIGVNKRYGIRDAGFKVTGLGDEVVFKKWEF